MTFKNKVDTILRENRLNIRTVAGMADYINIDRQSLARYYRKDKEPPQKVTKALLLGFDINGNWYYHGDGDIFLNDRPEDLLKKQIKLLEENKALLQRAFDEQSMKLLKLQADLHLMEEREIEHTINTKYI